MCQYKALTASTFITKTALISFGLTDVHGDNIVKVDLDGNELARITRDKFPLPEDSPFKPTASAVDPTTGDIWVTDGYGSSTVHCFSSDS